MKKIKFISIDLQNDFVSEGGVAYLPRESILFIKKKLIPFFEKNNINVLEVISDYRQPKPRSPKNICVPGQWSYKSLIPNKIKNKDIWIKCMNSPLWIRKNIGDPNLRPGRPYQDTNAFDYWLNKHLGNPNRIDEVILFGLTLDCCVLCMAQELSWRGYKVRILEEAVDNYSGDIEEKKYTLNNPPLTNWSKAISWKELQFYFNKN